MKPLIFINSHPIQYFAPLYKYMNENGLPTSAWYCSDESIKGGLDQQFGTEVKWDIPLLEGYSSRFFKNYSWKPSHFNGFFGLINLGMITELFKIKKSVIIVHGWHFFTHLLIILLGKLKGHTICFRYEMPNNQELQKKGWKQEVKRTFLKHVVFPRVDYFLYIGSQNRMLYQSYNIPSEKLIFCPYSVDNKRFQLQRNVLSAEKTRFKTSIGIPEYDKVILYSGKYILKKRPLDILKAFSQLGKEDCWLIMVGEGELRKELEALIIKEQINNVILTGFINQSKIASYYSISDVFVMCSSIGETWGLSVNEAMNFNLPVVISDLTGSATDLVQNGINGYIYPTGEISSLTDALRKVLYENKLSWTISSEKIISTYSYETILKNLNPLCLS